MGNIVDARGKKIIIINIYIPKAGGLVSARSLDVVGIFRGLASSVAVPKQSGSSDSFRWADSGLLLLVRNKTGEDE